MSNQKLEQPCYCMDFGFCYDYPKEYWFNYFDTLGRYGFNTIWLWVAGCLPVKGFEKTLAWQCDYVSPVVDYLHRRGMRVHLMSGVFGWLGMSPGLIRMNPDVEITWSEELKKQYPLDSTRRGICPTRGRDLCIDYLEGLYRACPQADGMALEMFCEKPHCQCPECTGKGHWKIELESLRAISDRLWRINPKAEIVWPFGYERTHGTDPESRLYDELKAMRDPRYTWWQVRMKNGYVDRQGKRHEWMDPAELAPFRDRLICLAGAPEEFHAAHQAGARGISPIGPVIRYLFLPEVDPIHFGYTVKGPPAEPSLYDHALFHIWAYRRQRQVENPTWNPEDFRCEVAEKFFESSDEKGLRRADDLLLLENLILQQRVCMARSKGRIWGDIDGGDSVNKIQLDPKYLDDLRRMSQVATQNNWMEQMRRTADALVKLSQAGL
jgi:hypothetical protein